MTSKAINITNYQEAIGAGSIPGRFEGQGSGARFVFPEVVATNSRGATLRWQVTVHAEDGRGRPAPLSANSLVPGAGVPAGVRGVITKSSYQVNAKGVRGKTRGGTKPTVVTAGKNLGKRNATNPITQALRDALSAYNSQLRRAGGSGAQQRGGVKTTPRTPPPMLVKRLGETKGALLTPQTFAAGVTVQRKYNGVRSPAFLRGGDVFFYSRTGSEYPGLAHLRAALKPVLEGAGGQVYLDGELYAHGQPLQKISGEARRGDGGTDLGYVVYDCFWPGEKAAGRDRPSAERQKFLDVLFGANPPKGVQRAENFPVSSLAETFALRDRFLAEGYEGAIARKDDAGYKYGYNNYHSDNLVKIKPIYDAEFKVVGYEEGKGKDKGAVIWTCEVDPEHTKNPNDNTFRVVPKNLTNAERRELFEKLGQVRAGRTRFEREFAGKLITVEFPERSTKTGKPTQAKALGFRADEPGASDPQTQLLEKR